MANVISLHSRQVFLSAGEPAAYAQAYFYESGTETQVNVYSDTALLNVRSQPVECDADGVLPPCYIGSPDPLRVLITDEDDVALPGYPMDNIVPLTAEAAAANTIGFSPTSAVPETDVQAAIEYVAAQFTGQGDLIARGHTPYVTGGTGNAYTITPSPAITSYTAGQSFLMRPDRDNTGSATLNINGLGARALTKVNAAGSPVALSARELIAGREVQVYDDGTQILVTLGRDNVRYGANGNGTWVQFSDGTQLCSVTLSWAAASDTSTHGGFRTPASAGGLWTFPAAFIVAPKVSATVENASAFGAGAGTVTATSVPVYATTIGTEVSGTRVISVIAIGRWF